MIQVNKISKSYGERVLFEDVTFSINPRERLGLVGRNGHGKSTLFKILATIEQTDSGSIHYPEDYTIGYLQQTLEFKGLTVLDEASSVLPELEGGWKELHKAEEILLGLGFLQEQFSISPLELSGGFQIRLNLAKLIISAPDLLLLDEPTNYLDIVSMRWLTRFIKNWQSELILITHDHDFLNRVCTHTLGIHRKKIKKLEASTEKFFELLAQQEELQEQQRVNQEKKIKQTEQFISRFRAKSTKAKAVQSRIKALDKMDKIEKLDDESSLDFDFNYKHMPGKTLLEVNDVSFHYPEQEEFLFKDLNLTVRPKDRIAVIGKNGKGKSTLLNIIANELSPLKGDLRVSDNTKISFFGQTNKERLNTSNTIEKELLEVTPNFNRTLARTVAGVMMFEGDDALKKIKILSGGEKSRVLLGKIILNEANLLILDEPTNHLDMYSSEALKRAIKNFPGAVIIVTHSEGFIEEIANRLVIFDRGKVDVFEGTYKDFIRRIGWNSEDGQGGKESSKKSAGPKLSKKELRQLRAKKAEKLGPIKKQIKKIENEITSLEKQVAKDNAELVERTVSGFGQKEAELSKDIADNKARIEELFQELEVKSSELEELLSP